MKNNEDRFQINVLFGVTKKYRFCYGEVMFYPFPGLNVQIADNFRTFNSRSFIYIKWFVHPDLNNLGRHLDAEHGAAYPISFHPSVMCFRLLYAVLPRLLGERTAPSSLSFLPCCSTL